MHLANTDSEHAKCQTLCKSGAAWMKKVQRRLLITQQMYKPVRADCQPSRTQSLIVVPSIWDWFYIDLADKFCSMVCPTPIPICSILACAIPQPPPMH